MENKKYDKIQYLPDGNIDLANGLIGAEQNDELHERLITEREMIEAGLAFYALRSIHVV